MTRIGTPLTRTQTKLLLLGSGELGKEVAIEAQRLGVYVVACDRYDNAPAMQVAHARHVFPMNDGDRLREVLRAEKPDYVLPEIEAIATEVLAELEAEGMNIIPTARAAQLTMDREGIRRLAAEELGLETSPYRFAATREEFDAAVAELGLPVVVKPVMSSSGKGQSTIPADGGPDAIERSWRIAQEGTRGGSGGITRVIVESFVEFEYEITLLTLRHAGGTDFCPPIGHRQEGGDYQESWQPQVMSPKARETAEQMARAVTDSLGGRGIFGVEFFVAGDHVWFSEVSPRPHDTCMVTMISQELSEFALHIRAVLGLPVPEIHLVTPGASHVILGHGDSDAPAFTITDRALSTPGTQIRLFGKPEVRGHRRLGVALARAETTDAAREAAAEAARGVDVHLDG